MAEKKSTTLAEVARNDGWVNSVSGIGTTRDKSVAGFYLSGLKISDQELESLYYFEDIAAKIVDKRPDEAFRKGYTIESKDETEDDGGEKLADLQKEAEDRLDVDTNIQNAWRWGRCYGGALVLMGVNDGQPMDKPVNETRIKGIDYLNVVDRRFIRVASYFGNPLEPNYGQPEIYEIFQLSENLPTEKAVKGGIHGLARIHASRVIRFDGLTTDRRKQRELAGWSYSVLQRVYDTLRQFGTSFASAGILLSEASQGVFKIDGLIDMIAGNKKDVLMQRMALVDQSKSVARSILLDSQSEEYTRIATSFSGMPELLDRFIQRMAASADMPVTVLMGISPAGLNATGASDLRLWYDTIASEQDKILTARLLKLYRYLAIAQKIDPTKIKICWKPLYELTELENADLYNKTASADKIYVDMGAVQPEEVAIARWGSGRYTPGAPIAIEVDQLQEQLDAPPLKLPPQLPPGTDPNLDPNANPDQTDPETEAAPVSSPGKTENASDAPKPKAGRKPLPSGSKKPIPGNA